MRKPHDTGGPSHPQRWIAPVSTPERWGSPWRTAPASVLSGCSHACAVCEGEINRPHPHLINGTQRVRMCLCDGCFDQLPGRRPRKRIRAVPARYLSFPQLSMPEYRPGDVVLPLGITIVFRTAIDDWLIACWANVDRPIEVGLTSDLWPRLKAVNPELATWRPTAESLLLRRQGEPADPLSGLIVPIGECTPFLESLASRASGPRSAARKNTADTLAKLWAHAEGRA